MPTHSRQDRRHQGGEEIARAQGRAAFGRNCGRNSPTRPPGSRFLPRGQRFPGPIHLIAEVKKASPSKGILRADFDPLAIARIYEAQRRPGALSVLTDCRVLSGEPGLSAAKSGRAVFDFRLLRKDFILDEIPAGRGPRLAGADGVLLIAECLDDCHLRALHKRSGRNLGMTPFGRAVRGPRICRGFLEAGGHAGGDQQPRPSGNLRGRSGAHVAECGHRFRRTAQVRGGKAASALVPMSSSWKAAGNRGHAGGRDLHARKRDIGAAVDRLPGARLRPSPTAPARPSMPYMPGFLPYRKLRGGQRPVRVAVAGWWLLTVSSIVSPKKPNSTVCSPGLSPVRMAWVADFLMGAACQPALRGRACDRSAPFPWAHESPRNLRAVPLGESSLKRWCRSMISTSTPEGWFLTAARLRVAG